MRKCCTIRLCGAEHFQEAMQRKLRIFCFNPELSRKGRHVWRQWTTWLPPSFYLKRIQTEKVNVQSAADQLFAPRLPQQYQVEPAENVHSQDRGSVPESTHGGYCFKSWGMIRFSVLVGFHPSRIRVASICFTARLARCGTFGVYDTWGLDLWRSMHAAL